MKIKPISRQDYIKQQLADCEGWFKEHVAQRLSATEFVGEPHKSSTVISFQKPNTWVYGMRIIMHGRWLCIMGDIGECIHEWSESLTLPFLAGIDLHYYLGKCQASDDGRNPNATWDLNVAAHFLDDLEKSETPNTYIKTLVDNLRRCGYLREEFDREAREYYDDFGDPEMAAMIHEAGLVPSAQAIGRFVGMQSAVKQLLKRV